MNMREAIARGKIHLFSEFEDAIKEPSHKTNLSYVNKRSQNFGLVDASEKQDLHKLRLRLTYATVDTLSEIYTCIDDH